MPDVRLKIAENLAAVRGRIADAAARSGRCAQDVTLVAVTKYVGPRAAQMLVDAGCRALGESRPQSLWSKAAALASAAESPGASRVRWHLIGHLQRNKVARTLPLTALIHSVDSPRLLTAIETEAARIGRQVAVLVEVNVSGEPSKHGVAEDRVAPLLAAAAGCRHVEVCGLMTMARLDGGRETARIDFARLRELRDALAPECPSGVRLAELSMGMSGDFDVAVEEGATIVRIGSALFEGLTMEEVSGEGDTS